MDKTEDIIKELPTEKKVEPIKSKEVSPVDARRATQIATEYLEGIYGNLSMLLFRLEDVRMNGATDRYLVLCSLLTNIGGPRSYYFLKVNVVDGTIIKIAKGLRNIETNAIDWKEENLPEGEE